MKIKDFTALKNKEIKDLLKLAEEKRVEAKKAKLNQLAGKEKNLKIFRNLRRDIAQINTLIREKQIIEQMTPKFEVKAEKKTKK